MNEKRYTKLSELVDQDFTIEKVWGYKWKFWDSSTNTMLVSETYESGYSKRYGLSTSGGELEVSAGQIGNMLEATMQQGKADLIGKTFHVKSNGQTGKEIRYYINLVRKSQPSTQDDNLSMPEGW